MDTHGLPGAELVEQGIRDLRDGVETIESLLVSLAAPALVGSPGTELEFAL